MFRTASDPRPGLCLIAAAILAVGTAPAAMAAVTAAAQQAAPAGPVRSTQVSLSGDAAELTLELADGRTLELGLRNGQVRLDGDVVGSYETDDALDRSWRGLLESLSGSMQQVGTRLAGWQPPSGAAAGRLSAAITDALQQAGGTPGAAAPLSDSVERLNERLSRIRSEYDSLRGVLEAAGAGAAGAGIIEEIRRDVRQEVEREMRREFARERSRRASSSWFSRRVDRISDGLGGIVSLLALYAILIGLGFAVVFFGRTGLERAADTARYQTVRSWLVGMAGTFLVLPAFVLGALALTISIVGIPLLLVWLPLFPVAVVVACIFGYLAVGHAAGEALAERRFYGGEWFKRANSYYYMLTGIGLLLALWFAMCLLEMVGPWFDFVQGLIIFLGVVLTWAAFTIGFGAVLLSRGGTRSPEGVPDATPTGSDMGKEAHV